MAVCQSGVDRLEWNHYNKEWCAGNPGSCPPVPASIPFDSFVLREWTPPARTVRECESFDQAKVAQLMKDTEDYAVVIYVTAGGVGSLGRNWPTWVDSGLLPNAQEVIVVPDWVSTLMTDVMKPYDPEGPFKITMIPQTQGSMHAALDILFKTTTKEYVLFLKEDYRAVESLPCVMEQIHSAVSLLKAKTADFVKLRSRTFPGKPNWAEAFKGREDDILSTQADLLCNTYHWIDEPEKQWPTHFQECSKSPRFLCVDSAFCNWSFDPFMIRTKWWSESFDALFGEVYDKSTSFNMEAFFNWRPEVWRDRKFVVAEGEGIFRKASATEFGF